jgi:RsiW-degrading membrane proteinase PrsW (M82 family)
MSGAVAAEDLFLLLLTALVPAIAYLSWIRSSERYRAEPWGAVLWLFAFGALAATLIAAVLEAILLDAGTAASNAVPQPEFSFLNGNSTAGQFFLILVIAPFVEEALKAWGVARYRARIQVLADGPVFGASVGLGFGFFETFLYGFGEYLVGGLVAGLTIILVRSISSVLLHGSSTAMFGQGYARAKLEGRGGLAAAYYLLAVSMHASFNLLASLGAVSMAFGLGATVGGYASVLGLFAVVAFAVGAINHVVDVIHQGSFPSAGGGTSKYRPPSIQARRPPSG